MRLRTAGLIDRTIDRWEIDCGPSTLKNTVSALVRVLDEAVRDGLITTNPARTRSRRTWNKVAGRLESRRSQALADLPSLMKLVAAVSEIEPVYGAWVMLCALLSARGSEVNGLMVGDVDLAAGLVHIRRPASAALVRGPRGGVITTASLRRCDRVG